MELFETPTIKPYQSNLTIKGLQSPIICLMVFFLYSEIKLIEFDDLIILSCHI